MGTGTIGRSTLGSYVTATTAVTTLLVSRFAGFVCTSNVVKVVITVIVFISNVSVIGSVSDHLLNGTPSPRLIGRVRDVVLRRGFVFNIRSLVIRSCNPNEVVTSTRTRIPDSTSVVRIRRIVSLARGVVDGELGIGVYVRVSPVIMGSREVGRSHRVVHRIVGRCSRGFSFRSFEIISKGRHAGFVFSLIVPRGCPGSGRRVVGSLRTRVVGGSGETFLIVAIRRDFAWTDKCGRRSCCGCGAVSIGKNFRSTTVEGGGALGGRGRKRGDDQGGGVHSAYGHHNDRHVRQRHGRGAGQCQRKCRVREQRTWVQFGQVRGRFNKRFKWGSSCGTCKGNIMFLHEQQ